MPNEQDDLLEYLDRNQASSDIYFCPTPLSKRQRTKNNIPYSYCLWADLDDCPPEKLLIPPTVLVETSPDRYQAYWKLKHMGSPWDVEDANRRIAYYHAADGCDRSGWDLTQMLRVPGTFNFKSAAPKAVKLLDYNTSRLYDLSDFSVYPEVEDVTAPKYQPLPKDTALPKETAEQILEDLANSAHPRVWRLFREVPATDWSSTLWDLEQTLFEVGASPEQVFIVVKDAACNKFSRDGLGDLPLWKEVQRAFAVYKRKGFSATYSDEPTISSDRDILTLEERTFAHEYPCFIDEYKAWGSQACDAPPQYHIAGACIIMSTLMAHRIKLATSFGSIIPNLWFMILADTTLTRKSTTMDMATDIS